MKEERVRPIAICVCRHGDRILVAEMYDNVKRETFYRPLGGTIEFGERAEEAVQREFQEEIGTPLENVKCLGMLENIFTCEGERGHEIVLVFDASLVDRSLYNKDVIQGDELGSPFKAYWKSLGEFIPGKPPVYPDGLVDLLTQ